ncbi:MAG: xanthine dehydrogenase family protein molybdopterin-binding subunit, partial [Chloroflexota bacterium]|nr:xanthine dehydrogenase family protein molybdopterin-binding subunit [Chloroflexota bacterium]
MTAQAAKYVGTSVPRKEDAALLTGAACFVSDISLAGMLHAAVLRSVHAHARINRVDLSAARALAGVTAAFDGEALRGQFPEISLMAGPTVDVRSFPERVLAYDKVRYAGEPVAVVVAESRRVAEDALDLIEVEYEPLPAVVELDQALASAAPLVHEQLGSNLAGQQTQTVGDLEKAFQEAAHVLQERVTVHRGAGHALETRAVLASYEKKTGALTVWATSQGVHRLQRALCSMLRLPEHRVRVITPFVGGGFGPKGGTDPELTLVSWLAMQLDRPVKWVEDRREHCVAAKQERDQIHDAAIAFDHSGRIL